MKTLVRVFLLAYSGVACADHEEGAWNWYYAGFCSPEIGSSLCSRWGMATVKISDATIVLRFSEKALPEMKASFSGQITNAGVMHGTLKEFFFSEGSDELSGIYTQKGDPQTCKWREIILRPNVPDGSILMLARTEGPCQSEPEDEESISGTPTH